MKEQRKLTLQMALLFLIVFVFFGVIIVNEKLSFLKTPKIEEIIDSYLQENYKNILNDFITEDVVYNHLKYERKITSKENENYYFYIYYEDKKISDTFQKDYVKGDSIISYQQEQIQKNIKKITKKNYDIKIESSLNQYPESLKKQIITSKAPEQLKIYTLEAKISIDNLTAEKAITEIKKVKDSLYRNNITPNTYCFIITETNNKEKSIKISHIDNDLFENNELDTIISDIINHRKNSLLEIYNINYEYIN